MSAQAKQRARPTLSSLPREILTAIALLLDRPSAQSLALTSRLLNACCEQRLWRDLDFTIPPHTGKLPYVLLNEGSVEDLDHLRCIEDEGAEGRRQMVMRDKVKAVMNAADRRRWGMVETVKLDVRPGPINGYIQLLDNVPKLKQLELVCPLDDSTDGELVAYHETLDFRMIGSGLSFPSLTHIRIGLSAIRFAEFITMLCDAAPSLISLIVHLTADISSASDELSPEIMPSFPAFTKPSLIRELRLSLPNWSVKDPIVVDILRLTPELQRLHLDFEEGDDVGHFDAVAGTLIRLSHLKELFWNTSPLNFWCRVDASTIPGRQNFPCLQRLILAGEFWHDVFIDLPELSSLEEFYCTLPTTPASRPTPPLRLPKYVESQALLPHTADTLPICPALNVTRTIRGFIDLGGFEVFSAMNGPGALTDARGFVRSFKHGPSSEVFHARFLLEYDETADYVDPDTSDRRSNSTPTCLHYLADRGVKRIKDYRLSLDGPSWQEFTDFKGRVVPLGIISKMREVEGDKAGGWEGRGIEVGAAAWKVLTDWEEVERSKEAEAGES